MLLSGLPPEHHVERDSKEDSARGLRDLQLPERGDVLHTSQEEQELVRLAGVGRRDLKP